MSPAGRGALVTGASSGIGKAFAQLLAAEGYDVLLVARRADRLGALAEELRHATGVRCEVLAADLADPGTPEHIAAHADGHGFEVDVLVNNAGTSSNGAFAETPWPTLAAELQVMVTAVTQLAHLVAPGMKERGWGRIVNVSSLAALSPPGQSLLYSGIKSYVLLMSQSLDMELRPHGVHVTALCPGFTRSEFHEVMGSDEAVARVPGPLWQEPEDVVREAWAAVGAGRPVCVPGTVNKLFAAAVRPLPRSLQYRLGRDLNPLAH